MSSPGTANAPARWPDLLALAAPFLALGLALSPMAAPFSGHDVNAHLARIAQWHRGVLEGVVYPRYVHDVHWGFGGPVMIFQPPLPYLLTEAFMLLGAGPMRALQLGIAVGLVAGVLGLYVLARPDMGAAAASVAAAAYAIVPYRLLDAWVRAAYPELLATAIVPLLLVAARATAERSAGPAGAAVAALSALLLLTHAPTSLFAIPLAVAYGVYRSTRAERGSATRRLLASVALGFGLSAFFWLPATLERGNTEFDRSVGPASYFFYGHHFVELRQLWETRWGFGESLPGSTDGMSFQLGRLHWIGLLGALVMAWRGPGSMRRELRFWLAATAAALYLMTAPSQWVWRLLPLLHPVQFPWRFLIVPALASSLFVGTLVRLGDGRPTTVQGLLVAFVVGGLAASYAPYATSRRAPPGLDAKVTPEGLQGWTGAHSVWLPRGARPDAAPGPRLQAVSGTAVVRLLDDRTHRLAARIQAEGPVSLRARILAYPGWRAYVDGADVPIRADPGSGAIVVDVPAGDHELRLRFGSTPARSAGLLISVSSLLVGAGLFRLRPAPVSPPAGS